MHLAALTGRRMIVAAASALTVVSVVSLDAVAGTGATHTAGLAVLALMAGGARIALAGRHRGVFATVSAALVAQPAVHAVGEGLDPAMAHAPATAPHLEYGAVAGFVASAAQLVLAGLVIVGVGIAEWLLELVAFTVGRAVRFLSLFLRGGSRRVAAGPTPAVTCRSVRVGGIWVDFAARRGPPPRVLSAPA